LAPGNTERRPVSVVSLSAWPSNGHQTVKGDVHMHFPGTRREILASILSRSVFALLLLQVARPFPSFAQDQQKDLTTESLEDLMNIQVTSASKKEQQLLRTPAAIFVISAEDIARSGARNIPDLLRMVPGVQVVQIDANTWGVSIRGLNEEFSNKLLVLVDGRSVYTPTFGGVYWETVNMPLEDIERIEVIRGPGGTVWGANAVQGVINIITKKASETKGAMVVGGYGTLEHGIGTLQYGAKLGGNTDGRAYLQTSIQDQLVGMGGQAAGDGWEILNTGFRSDTVASPEDKVSLSGNLYLGHEGQNLASASGTFPHVEGNFGGGSIHGTWDHSESASAGSTLSVSFDRNVHLVPITDRRNTLDAAFQEHFSWGTRQDIVAGVEYQFTKHNSLPFFSVVDSTRQQFSLFIQDEIALLPDHLYLTLGTKGAYNEYTGMGDMPSARLAWQLNKSQLLWTAVSRALRTPDSVDTYIHDEGSVGLGPGGIPIEIDLTGNPHLRNETLLAYEAGYRTFPTNSVSVELSAYFNSYHDLRADIVEALTFDPGPPPVFILPSTIENLIHGDTLGAELSANWRVTRNWTLSPGYAYEGFHMHVLPALTGGPSFQTAEDGSPVHSAQLRSHLQLPHKIDWDAAAYFVDRLPLLAIPSYTRVDTGLTWHFAERGSLSIVGQNLVNDHHPESPNSSALIEAAQVKRSVYGQFEWRFR
jgi:iron complex outermembrane recepter protein